MGKQGNLRVINGGSVRRAHKDVHRKVRKAHIFLVPILDEWGFEVPDRGISREPPSDSAGDETAQSG